MRLICLAAAVLGLAGIAANAAADPWEQPASGLAEQIAAILGPGQAHLTIRNISSLPSDAIPTIRRLLVQDLRLHGVTVAGAESANAVRVTLSENAQERLLVAEVVEGSQTQVAIVDLGPIEQETTTDSGSVTLLSQQILTSQNPVLAMAESPSGLVVLESSVITLYTHAATGWQKQKRMPIEQRRQLTRDPRGVLVTTGDQRFQAWLPGTRCDGGTSATGSSGDWTVHCRESDDPWPIAQAQAASASEQTGSSATQVTPALSAFYNASRDYYTGVVTPGIGIDLPPFYSATLIPRQAGSAALLMGGIDGKVQLVENGAVRPVAGTRDWGSDFAMLHSGCGTGVQIIVSGSGEATTDSLRAYEVPALEARPVSAPEAMNGTVMTLWTAPDGKSVFAIIRNAANQYEVNRVTALCN